MQSQGVSVSAPPQIRVDTSCDVKYKEGSMTDGLTKRELQVLNQAKMGATNQEIADSLKIGVSTVKIHTANIRRKLGKASNMAGAVYHAMKYDIIN